MDFENEELTILYGSQTGNAEDLAERIWRESKRFYFKSAVKALDDYNILDLINKKCVIFVCSTTGQGEEPDNMKNFWKFILRKKLPGDVLDMQYLGWEIRVMLNLTLLQKGYIKECNNWRAKELIPLGLGDDQHDLGYDATADPWMEELWRNLLLIYPLPSGIQPLPRNHKIHPRLEWNVSTIAQNGAHDINYKQSIYYSTRRCTDFTATVSEYKTKEKQLMIIFKVLTKSGIPGISSGN
ncbi:hypothetical protein NQ317_015896 [Molorchus minor]|uniref:Flavodoxin-like domain-containing protein n=1 Tax=Molorchus minor TaxID=1323400 RepID=A0ABQ9JCI0_9CUCU|nr:hypothetical protein NQ317_015896 [Molorchus minor]